MQRLAAATGISLHSVPAVSIEKTVAIILNIVQTAETKMNARYYPEILKILIK